MYGYPNCHTSNDLGGANSEGACENGRTGGLQQRTTPKAIGFLRVLEIKMQDDQVWDRRKMTLNHNFVASTQKISRRLQPILGEDP